MNASLAGQPFTSAGAAAALEQACAQAAIRSQGAELLRMGENALFRLPQEQIVVRIARGPGVLEDAKKEVAVATWLRDAGLPAAATTAHSQPIMVQNRPVTFWKLIEDSGIKATLVDLAGILQALHSLPVPPNLALPKLDIFDRVAERRLTGAESTGPRRAVTLAMTGSSAPASPARACSAHWLTAASRSSGSPGLARRLW